MNLGSWIASQFQTSDYTLEKWDKGISNHNYLLTVADQRYVLRKPKISNTHLNIQYAREKEVLQYVQDLDVQTVCFDEHNGIKVTRMVEDVLEFHETSDPEKFKKTGHLLKTLHTKEISVDFTFDPFEKLYHYKEQVQHPLFVFPKEKEILSAVRSIYIPDTLCHNDVVQGNILFAADREYLIDWEYSAMNDRRFDIASFFSENQITDAESRTLFYQGYEIETDDNEVKLFEALEDILWGYWANLFYELQKEDIYLEILEDKKNHYINILKEIF